MGFFFLGILGSGAIKAISLSSDPIAYRDFSRHVGIYVSRSNSAAFYDSRYKCIYYGRIFLLCMRKCVYGERARVRYEKPYVCANNINACI